MATGLEFHDNQLQWSEHPNKLHVQLALQTSPVVNLIIWVNYLSNIKESKSTYFLTMEWVLGYSVYIENWLGESH